MHGLGMIILYLLTLPLTAVLSSIRFVAALIIAVSELLLAWEFRMLDYFDYFDEDGPILSDQVDTRKPEE